MRRPPSGKLSSKPPVSARPDRFQRLAGPATASGTVRPANHHQSGGRGQASPTHRAGPSQPASNESAPSSSIRSSGCASKAPVMTPSTRISDLPTIEQRATAPRLRQLLREAAAHGPPPASVAAPYLAQEVPLLDRKSTRLNSSHGSISYDVF